MITQSVLKEHLDYDRKTGIFVRKKKTNRNQTIGEVAGYVHSSGYRYIHICGKMRLAHRLAWLYEYGYFPENLIDHKNRMKDQNWIDNLGEASYSCNAFNSGIPSNNSSGVKGVYWCAPNKKWQAQIQIGGKGISLGSYDTLLEAAYARLAGEQCLGKQYCGFVSPAMQYIKDNS